MAPLIISSLWLARRLVCLGLAAPPAARGRNVADFKRRPPPAQELPGRGDISRKSSDTRTRRRYVETGADPVAGEPTRLLRRRRPRDPNRRAGDRAVGRAGLCPAGDRD